jgi:haloacetate dehalogenase
MMGADPDWFIKKKLAKTEQGLSFFNQVALAEYMRCFRNPETIHAMCEDYRATFGIDLELDTADFETGRKVACPALILWGATGGVGRNHRPQEVWPSYAENIVRMATVPSGHYLQEECPAETAAELLAFFTDPSPATHR